MISRIAVVLLIYPCLIFLSPAALGHGKWIGRSSCGAGSIESATGPGVSNSCVEKAKEEYKSRRGRGHGHRGHGHHGGHSGDGTTGSSGDTAGASGGSGGIGTASTVPQTQMPSTGMIALTVFTQAMLKNQQGPSHQPQALPKAELPGGNPAGGTNDEESENASGGPSGASSGHASTSDAQAEVARDLATCSSAQSRANQCCNNPMSCSGGLDPLESKSLSTVSNLLNSPPAAGGLTDYCKQMNSLGSEAENVNIGFGNVCFDSHMECNVTCEDLAEKYNNLISNCNGCEAHSIYENARRSLNSSAKACDGLTSKTTQLANNGFSTILNQNMAKYCNQVGSVNSGATSAAQAARDAGMPNSAGALAMNCTDPNLPECKVVKEGKVDSQATSSKVKKSDLSADAAGGFKGYGNSKPSTQAPQAAGRSLNPNTQAPMAAASVATAPPAAAHKTQAPLAKAEDTKKEPDKSKNETAPIRVPASEEVVPIASNDSQFSGEANLRQFLPGGSRAAGRRMAGGNEINAKEENIFLRISNKMMEKCRLGILLECR